MSIHELIKEKRKAKGLTQIALAEALEVTQKDISRWETYVTPTNMNLANLMMALDIDSQELHQAFKKEK